MFFAIGTHPTRRPLSLTYLLHPALAHMHFAFSLVASRLGPAAPDYGPLDPYHPRPLGPRFLRYDWGPGAGYTYTLFLSRTAVLHTPALTACRPVMCPPSRVPRAVPARPRLSRLSVFFYFSTFGLFVAHTSFSSLIAFVFTQLHHAYRQTRFLFASIY